MINTTTQTPASSLSDPDKNNNVNVFPIAFGVSIGALSFLSVVLIASYYACSRKRAPLRRTGSFSSNDDEDSSVTVETTTGLDQATLNSYPKLLYSHYNDENTPEDEDEDEDEDEEKGKGVDVIPSCPICLQEFKDSDVIRVVPECEHLYHVDCIDTWLKVHRTCPVCRSSPLPGPESVATRQRLSNGPWFVQMMR